MVINVSLWVGIHSYRRWRKLRRVKACEKEDVCQLLFCHCFCKRNSIFDLYRMNIKNVRIIHKFSKRNPFWLLKAPKYYFCMMQKATDQKHLVLVKNEVIFLNEVQSRSANEVKFKNKMKAQMTYILRLYFLYVMLNAIVQKTAWDVHDSKP